MKVFYHQSLLQKIFKSNTIIIFFFKCFWKLSLIIFNNSCILILISWIIVCFLTSKSNSTLLPFGLRYTLNSHLRFVQNFHTQHYLIIWFNILKKLYFKPTIFLMNSTIHSNGILSFYSKSWNLLPKVIYHEIYKVSDIAPYHRYV